MKRILIPTDYSPASFKALAFAERLALLLRGEIFLMHLQEAVDLTVHAAGVVATADRKVLSKNRSELFRLADELEHQGLKVHSIFVEDKGEQKIEDYLLPYNIDLIVMGSRGLTGLPAVMGSTTRSVIRHAHLPVIVLSEESEAAAPVKKILFASSFRKDERAAIFIVHELALLFNAELHIAFLNHPGHLH
ncbi:MAG: universal stress protein [Bacteroidetes bacterium]|nr:universal stress protein [Bacteroidota bacterium]